MIRSSLFLVGLAALASCTGAVNNEGSGGAGSAEDDPVGGENGDPGSGGGDGEGGIPGAFDGIDPTASCPADLPLGPAPLRRLSRTEYLATVKDLLPGVTVEALNIALDPVAEGFENRAHLLNSTDILVEQFNLAAATLSEMAVTAGLTKLVPCTPTGNEAACGAQFVDSFGSRAFRRPLTDAERKTFTDFFNQQRTTISFKAAVQLTIDAFLQAPAFLYRVELGERSTLTKGRMRLTDHELAVRLSYLFWSSMPDQELFDAAKAGKLHSSAELEAQARRLLKDTHHRAAMVDFHRQWLEFDRIKREMNKDIARYQTFNAALAASMREESNRFTEAVMVDGDGTLEALLTSNTAMVDPGLAKLYGVTAPASGWAQVALNPGERAGFLTRANFLTSHAHALSGSPPLRAVFVMKRLMCAPPPSPPADADITPPKQAPNTDAKTNRQLFEERTVGTCQGCHNIIDPIGFGLENYDAIGKYRTVDNGLPVDATGSFEVGDLAGSTFNGGVELSQRLAESVEVRQCATVQWYQFAFGRDKTDADDCKILALAKALDERGGDLRELLVSMVRTEDFMYRPEITP